MRAGLEGDRVNQQRSQALARAGRIAGAALLFALAASTSTAEPYSPQRAGHPVRILAYVLHPVGVAFDWLLFRPAHWIGGFEPFRTLSGRDLEGPR